LHLPYIEIIEEIVNEYEPTASEYEARELDK
jgi:hypothetical protein